VTDKKKQRGAGVAAVFGRPIATSPANQQAGEPASGYTGMPAIQQDSVVVEKQKAIKATYYIDPLLIKPLKFLSVERDTDLSALVNEAIRDLLAKYKGTGIE
jgi:hypothetical protein